MIVIMKPKTSAKHVAEVISQIEADGYQVNLADGDNQTLIGVVGESDKPFDPKKYEALPGVERVASVTVPYKLASREMHPQDTVVNVRGKVFGANKVQVIAGPCSVESREQIIDIAHAVKEAGAVALRGGAYKPRTSPYSFQGHGEKGLQWLAEAREQTGLPVVTEVMDSNLVPLVCQYADVLQIGARNMQNFALLHAVGESQHPVLLKRGMSSTMEDLLMAAEYILSHGNNRVMLCERGIRTFEKYTRNTFDLNAIPVLKHLSHLPVIADPSHAVGKREYVDALSRAAVAAGADGLIIEVHTDPEAALSDGRQTVSVPQFQQLMTHIQRIAEAIGRTA
ncbi:MAG: 3-deoxy-7-phosphoheptulonate synthase [Phototrophicales bacterium]|nr:MAG: 3-deoxy-7-phosphoheptulonate synthase [Phototrophicales bacterium]RMG73836.1 MAG: 3-deoxy-7-phosphoheptulonate synthase [Chloroflexota bacterium]